MLAIPASLTHVRPHGGSRRQGLDDFGAMFVLIRDLGSPSYTRPSRTSTHAMNAARASPATVKGYEAGGRLLQS